MSSILSSCGNLIILPPLTKKEKPIPPTLHIALHSCKSVMSHVRMTMDRLDMGEGTIRHAYIPDFLLAS